MFSKPCSMWGSVLCPVRLGFRTTGNRTCHNPDLLGPGNKKARQQHQLRTGCWAPLTEKCNNNGKRKEDKIISTIPRIQWKMDSGPGLHTRGKRCVAHRAAGPVACETGPVLGI